ncbi:MAG: NAD-dependent epimerase/dehydratase family protein [Rhodobacteraceae bacterium]|nr:NAD-dependent epimerase/dehydratase family protein [Paracoccaceae bacterium]
MHFPRVLVMGATGRIGGILRRVWGAGGSGDRVLWQSRAPAPGPGWVSLDPLAEPGALARAAAGTEAILCLSGVVPARAAAGADMADNTALALAAVRAGAEAGAAVLLASSAAVYGDCSEVLRETGALAPVSDYGRAKAAMEARAIALGAARGVAVTALRIGNVAGVDAALGGWRPGFRLDRFADGRTPRRSYIGPATLARVLGDLAAAAAGGGAPLPRALNVAAPGTVEMGALLDAAGLAWTPRPAPPGAIPEVVLDVSALRGFTALTARDSLPRNLVDEIRGLETGMPR